jgi:transcriptional regulator
MCRQQVTEATARDLFPGALEMMILESLRRQPAHGYALVQHIQQRSNNLLHVEEGSLYPALQRLLKAKLVKAEWGVSSTNRRVRTYQIRTHVRRYRACPQSGQIPSQLAGAFHGLDSKFLPPPQTLR